MRGAYNLPAQAVLVSKLAREHALNAEAEYDRLIGMLDGDEHAACHMLVTALLGRAHGPVAQADALSDAAIRLGCGRETGERLHAIMNTVDSAIQGAPVE